MLVPSLDGLMKAANSDMTYRKPKTTLFWKVLVWRKPVVAKRKRAIQTENFAKVEPVIPTACQVSTL